MIDVGNLYTVRKPSILTIIPEIYAIMNGPLGGFIGTYIVSIFLSESVSESALK